MKKSSFVSAGLVLLCANLSSCQSVPSNTARILAKARDANKFMIVDCLLPGQVRQLGSDFTYVSPRRPTRTSEQDCEIRGGEYTAYDRADYRTALRVWLAAAKRGSAEAQVNVGEIFEKGLGTQPDYALAAQWYHKAADQGNTRAEIDLGYLYEKGEGVERNMATALNWYRRASGLSNDNLQFASTLEAQAQHKLGRLRKQLALSRQEQTALRKKLHRTQLALNKQQHSLKQYEQQAANTSSADSNLRHVELQKRRQQIAALKTAAITFQHKLDKLDKATAAEQGPTIELLDPPLELTRGIPTVSLAPTIKQRIIVGKVTPPSVIASFTVNSQKEPIDSLGIFQVPVNVKPHMTPVSVVATDKYGQRATINFELVPRATHRATRIAMTEPAKAPALKGPVDINFGHYYALVIGNNRYANFPRLKSAVNDAKQVARVLSQQYGFKTKLLLNADRYTILSALNTLRKTLTSKDNLLIYYAGHGERDSDNGRGSWLPVDAQFNNPANWISSADITDFLGTMAATHILVVADSCYSGKMTSTSLSRLAPDLPNNLRMRWYKVMAVTQSRTALTSGGLQPVLDTGSNGHHSIFAQAFLHALRSNHSIMDTYAIYREVAIQVMKNASKLGIAQTPQYAPIKHCGHEAGEFLFVPKRLQEQNVG